MSKILANEIANYGDDSPIDLKEGLNIPAGKPVQAAGSSGTTGQVLSTTGTTVQWVTPFSGSYTDLSNRPTIPAAQVNSDWNASSGAAVILNKPVVPPQPSVTTASAGTAALTYNSGNGEFTFTPPDLSSYATETYVTSRGYLTSYTETDPIFSASAASNITTAKISNWDTSYSWGNHASVGYLTLESDTLQTVINRGNTSTSPAYFTSKFYYQNNFATADITIQLATQYPGMFITDSSTAKAYASFNNEWNELLTWYSSINDLNDVDTVTVAPQNGQVLKWDSTSSKWKPANDLTGGGGGGLSLSDLSVQSATAAGGGSLVYNDGSGVFTYTPPDLSSFITSLGDAIRDADFTTDGIMKRSGAGVYTSITDNTSNWDTAYGWGNHASQGYLTQLPVHGLGVHTGVTLTNETAGDLLRYSGTQWENWAPDYATQTWVQSQNYFVGIPSEVVQGNSKAEVIGTGQLDGEFKVTLQDATSNGAGKISFRQYTDGGYNITELNPYTDGNVSGNCKFILNNLTTTNAWSEIEFKKSGASSGTSLIRSNPGSNIQFFPVDGNVDFQVSGTGTYTRLNAVIAGSLTAGGLTYPTTNGTNGQVLTSDGAGNVAWAAGGGGGGASVTISDTPPAASAGDLWWESDSGRLKIYYQDVDSAQWVDVAPPLAPALSSNAPATASSTGSAGDIRYDSGYVYVCVATDTWKRAALTTW